MQGEPHPLPGAVLWYPEVRCGHLVDDFCSGANLSCSVDHLERWLGNNPTAGRVMSIDEAADLGRKTWREAADRVSIDREVIRFPLRIAAIMTTEPVGPLGPRPLGLGLAALLGCCAAHALIVGGVAATSIGLFGIPAVVIGAAVVALRWRSHGAMTIEGVPVSLALVTGGLATLNPHRRQGLCAARRVAVSGDRFAAGEVQGGRQAGGPLLVAFWSQAAGKGQQGL